MTQGRAVLYGAGLALVVFAAGFITASLLGDRKVEALQHYSDSVTVAAKADSAAANVFADSMLGVVDSLQKSKQPVTTRISQDSATARTAAEAVRRAVTASDSNKALVVQVASLESEVAGLRVNARTDSLSLWTAMRRGDSLQTVVNTQTTRISALNTRIQELTPRTPKWLKISFEVVKVGGAFYAGMQYERHRP